MVRRVGDEEWNGHQAVQASVAIILQSMTIESTWESISYPGVGDKVGLAQYSQVIKTVSGIHCSASNLGLLSDTLCDSTICNGSTSRSCPTLGIVYVIPSTSY